MILDQLANANLYFGLHERVAVALRFLQTCDAMTLTPGKHPVQGDAVYALVQDYTTKPRSEGTWEAHRRHIDVQYVASGSEEMGYAPITSLRSKKAYDEDGDYELYDGAGDFVRVPAGSFTVFFPNDGHIPGLAADNSPGPVRKIVVKVAV